MTQKVEELKKILKDEIKGCTSPLRIHKFKDLLHPCRLQELEVKIHEIQQLLVTEYVRHTELGSEIGLNNPEWIKREYGKSKNVYDR